MNETKQKKIDVIFVHYSEHRVPSKFHSFLIFSFIRERISLSVTYASIIHLWWWILKIRYLPLTIGIITKFRFTFEPPTCSIEKALQDRKFQKFLLLCTFNPFMVIIFHPGRYPPFPSAALLPRCISLFGLVLFLSNLARDVLIILILASPVSFSPSLPPICPLLRLQFRRSRRRRNVV